MAEIPTWTILDLISSFEIAFMMPLKVFRVFSEMERRMFDFVEIELITDLKVNFNGLRGEGWLVIIATFGEIGGHLNPGVFDV